jgi:hypothetical protein
MKATSIDNFIANRAANRKAMNDLDIEEDTSFETIPVQKMVNNAEGLLEYEFDDPLRIQDPVEDNVVPVAPFVPDHDKEEHIAGFLVDDDLIPPQPLLIQNRDIYDPAKQDKGSGDSCDEDVPKYDETTKSDLQPPPASRPKRTGTGTVLVKRLRYGKSAVTFCNTVAEILTLIIPTPIPYEQAIQSP